jgi:hypothetical protein
MPARVGIHDRLCAACSMRDALHQGIFADTVAVAHLGLIRHLVDGHFFLGRTNVE